MHTSRNDIEALNGLIETLIDSADGFERSAEVTENASLKSQFERLAGERRRIVEGFRARVRQLGGEPEDEGSLLAAAHRRFLDLRSAVQNGTEATLNEIDRGETYLESRFETALQSRSLNPETAALIREGWSQASSKHERMKQLRDALAA
jgi:uncharacterized protein (TIGR02284 family)